MGKRSIVLLVAITAILVSACQYWPQTMGDPAHDGNASGETSISLANVASLHEVYSIPGVTEPLNYPGVTTARGNLYIASSAGLVVASFGGAGCAGTPKVCQPLWTAGRADYGATGGVSQPDVWNTTVFQSSEGSSGGDLRAFDANGVTNCSGSPIVCQPLWTAAAPSDAGPVVDGSTLFINNRGNGNLEAYDANGVTNCSGTPTVCQPLWTAPVGARWIPTVANGKVYVATRSAPDQMEVFDEAGSTGCAGSPKICQPLFTAPLPGAVFGSVAVSGGVAYALTTAGLVAIDATGTTGCAGSPLVCQPRWTTAATISNGMLPDSPAVANGHVYVLSINGATSINLFDAAGTTDCSGSPVVCSAESSAPFAWGNSLSPTVSNGVVWTGGQAWNATDLNACGSPPCPPVANLGGAYGPTTISLGTVFLATGTNIEAFTS